jgi:hypothetical protein
MKMIFPSFFLILVFLIFFGGCMLFAAGSILTRFQALRCGSFYKIMAVVAWIWAMLILVICWVCGAFGYPII